MKDGTGTKLKIKAAGLKLFVEKGVAETTTRDLAHDAGVAEGTLYRHYVSKEELVADLFASHYQAYARRLSDIERREERTRAKLAAMIGDVCRLYDSDTTLFRFLLLTQHHAMPRLPANIETPVMVLQRVLAAGAAAGELRPLDVDLMAAMVLGLILQPATAMVYGQLAPPLTRFAPTLIAAVERAIFPS